MSGSGMPKNLDVSADLFAEVMETVEDHLSDMAALLEDIAHGRCDRVAGRAQFCQHLHSLKGLVRAFGLKPLADFCHAFEDYLAAHPGFEPKSLEIEGAAILGLQEALEDKRLDDPETLTALAQNSGFTV